MGIDLREIATNIELGSDGIWTARSSSNISYPAGGNEDCFSLEERSFWFRHRNECILHAVNSFPPPGTFFDVGGGNGYVSRALQTAGYEVVLLEPGRVGVLNSAKRGISQVVQSALFDAGFVPGSLPAVGMFDVLEHVENDGEFLRDLRRLLTPGARLYLTVPAFRGLWSKDDVEAGHWRRYTLNGLSQLLVRSGFEVEFATYFFRFLPLPIFLFRTLPYRFGWKKSRDANAVRSDHETKNAFTTWLTRMLTTRELSRISSGRRPRFGGSCLAVAKVKHSE
ncbi:MAG: class I SAM-dependent methyltransferase [Bryobacteraceae bacterium]